MGVSTPPNSVMTSSTAKMARTSLHAVSKNITCQPAQLLDWVWEHAQDTAIHMCACMWMQVMWLKSHTVQKLLNPLNAHPETTRNCVTRRLSGQIGVKWPSRRDILVHSAKSALTGTDVCGSLERWTLDTVGLVCYARLNLCDFPVKSIMRFLFIQ